MPNKPLLLINSPVDLRTTTVNHTKKHVAVKEKQGLNSLIAHQLRFLTRPNQFKRLVRLHLKSEQQIVGYIMSFVDGLVTTELNGVFKEIEATHIIKIEKF